MNIKNKYKKILFILSTILLLQFPSKKLSAEDTRTPSSNQILYRKTYPECDNLFKSYKLNILVRSKNGWIRLLNNNNIQQYGKMNFTETEKIYLYNCIIDYEDMIYYNDIKNRSIQ